MKTAAEIRDELGTNHDTTRDLLQRSLSALEESDEWNEHQELIREIRKELRVSQACIHFRPGHGVVAEHYADCLVSSCDGREYRIVFDVTDDSWPGEIRMYRDNEGDPFAKLVLSTEEVSE